MISFLDSIRSFHNFINFVRSPPCSTISFVLLTRIYVILYVCSSCRGTCPPARLLKAARPPTEPIAVPLQHSGITYAQITGSIETTRYQQQRRRWDSIAGTGGFHTLIDSIAALVEGGDLPLLPLPGKAYFLSLIHI